MTISRRQFNIATGASVALTVMGCGKKQKPAAAPPAKKKVQLAKEPFIAGDLEQYRAAGVYDQKYEETGVFLHSDGKKLVAISSKCTHSGCLCKWQADNSQYLCPCHGSIFSADGINDENAKADRPLDRMAVSLVESPNGAKQVQIDPTILFDDLKWDDPAASLELA